MKGAAMGGDPPLLVGYGHTQVGGSSFPKGPYSKTDSRKK